MWHCSDGQVRIHKFLEKSKRKKLNKQNKEEEGETNQEKVEEKLRKKVTDLIKKQKLVAVRKIVEGQDYSKPWGPEARAKVCVMSLFS